MIKRDHIKVTERKLTDDEKQEHVIGLCYEAKIVLRCGKRVSLFMMDEPAVLREAKHHAVEQIIYDVYGELSKDLNKLRHAVMCDLSNPGGFHDTHKIAEEFRKIQDKLKVK